MTISVIAVHGNGGGAFRWERLPLPLADGSGPNGERVELHGLTLPGFQGTPLPAGDISMATFTDAIVAEVEACPHPRVLLGHGIGGALALDAVAHHPALADGLILHAPVGANLDERWFPKVMSAPPIRKFAKAAVSSPITRTLAGPRLFANSPDGYGRRFLAEYARADGFEVMFDLLTAEWFEGLPPTSVPTTILWGDHDRVLQPSQADDLARRLEHSNRRIVEGWGHYPMIEQPRAYAAVVSDIAADLVDRGGR